MKNRVCGGQGQKDASESIDPTPNERQTRWINGWLNEPNRIVYANVKKITQFTSMCVCLAMKANDQKEIDSERVVGCMKVWSNDLRGRICAFRN